MVGNALAPRQALDIAEAISFPTRDPNWLKTCIVPGLCAFLPLVGPFVAIGWQHRVYQSIRQGEGEIPPLDFGRDLGAGFGVFFSILMNAFPLIFGFLFLFMGGGLIVGLVSAAVAQASQDAAALVAVLGNAFVAILALVFAFGFNLAAPELMRRVFNGEGFFLTSLGESRERIGRAGFGQLVMAAIGMMVANFVGSLGAWACFFGLVITMPFAYVSVAHLIAQWDALTAP